MKNAFTFAELMISLVVISVITAILYPTIADLGINENKALFKSAYRSLSLALSEVINDTDNGRLPDDLCAEMAKKLNVKGACSSNLITTTNGMRWYIPNNACANATDTRTIVIDVASSNNTLSNSGNPAYTFTSGAYGPDTGSKKQDTFQFTIQCDGRITNIDGYGYAHLSDSGAH